MVSDFFSTLTEKGHKVITVTHIYGYRKDICYLTNSLKVYYLPLRVMYNHLQLQLSSIVYRCSDTYLFRKELKLFILSSFPVMPMMLSLFHAKIQTSSWTISSLDLLMSVLCLQTKLLTVCLCDINHTICVSYTSKENTVLRAVLNPERVCHS